MRGFVFGVFLLIWQSSSLGQEIKSYPADPGLEPVDMFIDVVHLKADLQIDPVLQQVEGTATIRFRTILPTTEKMVFEVPGMSIHAVSIQNRKCSYELIGNQLVIRPLEKLAFEAEYFLTISYTGHIDKGGLHFSGWDDPTGRKRKQIWAHDPSWWLPYVNAKHDLLTTELLVRFDSRFRVFSNGQRLKTRRHGDGTSTWHYRMNKPHVIYLVCLVIGDYQWKELRTASGTPVELWYYPDQADHFETTYLHTLAMFSFLEQETGVRYPYEVYREAPVTDYLYAGMETTTATVFGDYLAGDARAFYGRNFVNVNVHELAHQWFGNYVSHLNNRHTWLTENFGTYYAKKFEQQVFGDDYYQNERRSELERTLEAAKADGFPIVHSRAGTARWYPKGSLVLDMLRDELGDTLFRKAIRHYLAEHAFDVAETNDFFQAVREATGQTLDWFYDQWYLRGGEPIFRVSYDLLPKDAPSRTCQVRIDQVHATGPLVGYFAVHAWMELFFKSGKSLKVRSWLASASDTVNIPIPDGEILAFVLFDPGWRIIKQLEFKRSLAELEAQLEMAPGMIDRYEALLALREVPIADKKKALGKAWARETFHLNRSEILAQLARDPSFESSSILKAAIKDPDPRVRKTLCENVRTIPASWRDDYEELLADSSVFNVELALENLCRSFPEKQESYRLATRDELGWRGLNIRIKWLELAIESGQNQYLTELIDYSGRSFEFETRMNALKALGRLNVMDESSALNLLDAYCHWNFKLSGVAKTGIESFLQQDSMRILLKNALSKGNFSPEKTQALLKAFPLLG